MKKLLYIANIVILILFFTSCNDNNLKFNKVSKKDRIDLAMEQEAKMTQNPRTGKVEREKLKEAFAYMKRKQAALSLNRAAISGVTWTERGPNNVGGRTRALLYDANDVSGNTVFAGSVGGGLWKTTDIDAASPNWVAIDDFFDNIAITTIAQDPTNNQNIYFGTGEGYFNADAIRGDGVWKSTDGGNSFSQLASTNNNFNFDFVQKILVTSNGTVLVATRSRYSNAGGLYRSVNGGTTFANVSQGLNFWACDIEEAANGDLYASFGIYNNDGIYKSTDDGATWVRVYTSNADEFRIELATAESNSNIIYGLIQENDNTIKSIIKSTNAGGTWNTVTLPSWSDQCGAPNNDFTRGQAFYDLTIAVDPNNANHVVIGGIDLLKTIDGGASWSQISEWANCSALADVHADQHNITFKPGSSSEMLIGNDGGVYLSTDANNASPSFSFKSYNYNVTQYYSCAIHPASGSNYFLAGAQDNGSHKFTNLGVNSVTEVSGGDGGFCHIDQVDPNYQFTSYVYNNHYRSTNGGGNFNYTLNRGTGQFINATAYDSDAGVMYMAGDPGILERWNDPKTGSTINLINIGLSGYISAIGIDPNTNNKIWLGTTTGDLCFITDANNTAPVTIINAANINGVGGYISCIAVENGDANHVLVTFSNYGVNSVWETTDGGTSWTSVEGNLPDMPVRWAIFSPVNGSMAMIATELGVWSTNSLNGGSTDWQPSVTGKANVRTDMIKVRESDNVVIAATHGRGLFSTTVFATASCDFVADKTLSYGGKDILFTDASIGATDWSWDFGDGTSSTEQNPVHQYTTAGQFTVSLTINSGTITETKTAYIHILPNRGTPYLNTDGGNFEVNQLDFGAESEVGNDLWELGTPSNVINNAFSGTNVWKTDLDANVSASDIEAYFYTPNYNLSAAGFYTLDFRMAMDIEYCNLPNGIQLQYSNDKGDSWNLLGSFGDASGTNWYQSGPSASCPISTFVFANQQAWAYNSLGNYINIQYDLSAFAGVSNMAFRFVFANTSGVSSEAYVDGVAIDNFQILGQNNSEMPLPIELLSFNGLPKDQGNEINWVTGSEINTDFFELYSSNNGIDFKLINTQKAQGYSTKETQYQYFDYDDSQNIYYKLIEHDLNGAQIDLGIINVNRTSNDWTVYPNPSQGFIRINTNLNLENSKIEVYNLWGQKIHSQSFQSLVDLSHLEKGIYYLKIDKEVKKVVLR